MPTLALKALELHEQASNSMIRLSAVRTDRWVVLVIIALALIVAFGLLTAWWIVCQSKGMYPALDMPSWANGGTWKAYCRR
ncbi:hypothetical protein GY21_01520 [Cryobacterium roopkundense]|uniref:Uncharacterized protein n=1 Tax=Cryobacterium roopkundense TaxID=1001240 RepID=A0A099JUK7_9MICO|nr:hypothetical protein [Cryobacterium roopkundense]KGJ81780.1 hypothetical protein GY21_01520 [Cryobacterium roopkundense]MBB5642408.1 hypothetical protein [Cryobacterium roopkundense]